MSTLTVEELRSLTSEQLDTLVQGYRDGLSRKRLPQRLEREYQHGFRVGRNDKKKRVEPFQAQLAAELRGKP